uniref:Uncharacterized protein n=1 Tax=Rhizophora mucronata TaxID=61149 RepID=A0A2P2KH98_RHIMU
MKEKQRRRKCGICACFTIDCWITGSRKWSLWRSFLEDSIPWNGGFLYFTIPTRLFTSSISLLKMLPDASPIAVRSLRLPFPVVQMLFDYDSDFFS